MRHREISVIDGVVAVGVLALLAFAPLAYVVANGETRNPEIIRFSAKVNHPSEQTLRDLPVGIPPG